MLHFCDLPVELQREVISWLQYSEAQPLRRVNKRMQLIVDSVNPDFTDEQSQRMLLNHAKYVDWMNGSIHQFDSCGGCIGHTWNQQLNFWPFAQSFFNWEILDDGCDGWGTPHFIVSVSSISALLKWRAKPHLCPNRNGNQSYITKDKFYRVGGCECCGQCLVSRFDLDGFYVSVPKDCPHDDTHTIKVIPDYRW